MSAVMSELTHPYVGEFYQPDVFDEQMTRLAGLGVYEVSSLEQLAEETGLDLCHDERYVGVNEVPIFVIASLDGVIAASKGDNVSRLTNAEAGALPYDPKGQLRAKKAEVEATVDGVLDEEKLRTLMKLNRAGLVIQMNAHGSEGGMQKLATGFMRGEFGNKKLMGEGGMRDYLRQRTPELLGRFVDSLVQDGEADFDHMVAERITYDAIAELLAVPHDDTDEDDNIVMRGILDMTQIMINVGDDRATNAARQRMNQSFQGTLMNIIIESEGGETGNSYLDKIMQKNAFSDALKENDPEFYQELMSLGGQEMLDGYDFASRLNSLIMLFVAGTETTRNAMSILVNGMLNDHEEHIAQGQEEQSQLSRLRAQHYSETDDEARFEYLKGVSNEAVRFTSSVTMMKRLAMEDVEIEGVTIPEGSIVVLLFAAANRDPRRFTDPNQLKFDRFADARSRRGGMDSEHAGFGAVGSGHFCAGANQALLEIAVLLESMLERDEDGSDMFDHMLDADRGLNQSNAFSVRSVTDFLFQNAA